MIIIAIEREREREREQIQRDISNLENKPNRTDEEEQELADKQKQLTKLQRPANNNDNSWLAPALIISRGLLIIGVIIVFITKKNKRKH